ncbi:Predicted transcriptional regulator [Streptomyces sp. SceaMP-e96]|uniref:BlaI/MecI/CopY family transcriptional regulator n=1 Tax=unclassified Streptomyces TaxID=2593676 RepID=UPI000823B196|nr:MULTISPECIES: BlaI/MecI/CopY family transcriptional regulator [unclassified Streptomyces]MYT17097.1 BlaI/MecI/CopY family transcriptional regulator [Streptomyces sp. SID4951]SCK39754.1 Predicted transcriptional regulator [Streptomyces sp. SceaMP-e96]
MGKEQEHRPGRTARRGPGELEAQILAALNRAPGRVSARWVQQQVGDGLAYTTVMTILTRLQAKHVARSELIGRSYVWQPTSDEAGLAALRMRKVLDSEPDRDAVLASFVSALSPQDEQLLRGLLVCDEGDEREA